MAGKIYVGDTGTDIILDSGADISSATTLQIKYKKPSGDTGAWTATVQSTTKAVYTTQAGDLDESGEWRIQIYVELSSWSGHGEAVSLTVNSLFE